MLRQLFLLLKRCQSGASHERVSEEADFSGVEAKVMHVLDYYTFLQKEYSMGFFRMCAGLFVLTTELCELNYKGYSVAAELSP